MIEVRIHGRHGQGVLTTAEQLAIAGSLEGRHSQALPYLGTEWTEDEVVAFCRIGDGELRDHETVTQPDALVVQDEDMLERALGLEGLRPGGYLLINSGRLFDNLGLPAFPLGAGHAITVPATEITRKVASRPIPHAAAAGGLTALCGMVSRESVLTAIRQRFPGFAGRAYAAAAMTTFGIVRTEIEDRTARRWHGDPRASPGISRDRVARRRDRRS